MSDEAPLGRWVRRFLLEHIIGERNLARNTQRSYRDTLRQLLPFVERQARKTVDRLVVEDLSADIVRLFLNDLEASRGCGIATRNQRLAAIHALARFIGLHSPEHIVWSGEVRVVPFKRASRPLVTYLEKHEMDALLEAPSAETAQGCRDRALLLYLYNTGARADEAAHTLIRDVYLTATPERECSSVLVRGKGNKLRRCPLWARTANVIQPLIAGRGPDEHVFLNRRRQPITRYGIHTLVERSARKLAPTIPSITKKRVSPHTIRHTTATHLLRAGVDINTIRAWLGHVSLSTTNIYAEVDLEMKAKALATCEVHDAKPDRSWKEQPGLMDFLRSL